MIVHNTYQGGVQAKEGRVKKMITIVDPRSCYLQFSQILNHGQRLELVK